MHSREEITQALTDDALTRYQEKEELVGSEQLREIERRVMLSVIDQKWREHLYEMDYLQEGINLRAMGQKDPLVEWQREGYDMFEAMMGAVQEDFVRYVFHLEVVRDQPARAPARRLSYSAPEDPVQGAQALQRAAVAEAAAAGTATAVADGEGDDDVVKVPVKVEKTPGRNEPCYCGSGKKYKFCHGR
jgi:preprotein translocase subunit SecA